MNYPVENILSDVKKALLNEKKAVLVAAPGAGKTTIVPISLLKEPWLKEKKIIILEPRRIAARSAAYRMAELLKEQTGMTVGYHVSMDKCTSAETRIEVITEGILTRRLQNDPGLTGTGLVIFDEFHERSIHSDLALALSLEVCGVFTDELRLLVMSATIDSTEVAKLLGDVPVIVSEGREWPVETRYVPIKKKTGFMSDFDRECADIVCQALKNDEGDILVFLPGEGEIRRIEKLLTTCITDSTVDIIPLFGRLSKKEQDRAILPSATEKRKVVLATSIAETSITIEGVTVVIDSGLMRISKYHPGSGMSRLETVSVSKASARQRRGRAGRTKPGICYRLWNEGMHAGLSEYNTPEIMIADLTAFILETAAWGVSDLRELKFLNYPAESSVDKAVETLIEIGAVDKDKKITVHGKGLTDFGLHPRLAHMLVKGKENEIYETACFLAAILNQRDFISFPGGHYESDISIRLEVLKSMDEKYKFYDNRIKINRQLASNILKNAARFKKKLSAETGTFQPERSGELLSYAYPERILKLRSGSAADYLMANGSGAYLSENDSLSSIDYLVAAELDGKQKKSRIFLAASFSEATLINTFHQKIVDVDTIKWDKKKASVITKKEKKYGTIVISSTHLNNADPEKVASEIISGVREKGMERLPWTTDLKAFQARVIFLRSTGLFDELADVSEHALLSTLDIWLKPFLSGVTRFSQIGKNDLKNAFLSLFDWQMMKLIDSEAPTHIIVPSGSKIPLKYYTKENGIELSPILSVRIQEVFGLSETPRIAGGKEPITIHLLSPAARPVQVTKDLKSFWQNTYFDVKKELAGRYPKHYWPDDPYTAMPTNKTKKAR